ncbi:MAG: hypothetical protein Q7R93_00230 [bacterium]|nr:hypothetical protein [bacterium]
MSEYNFAEFKDAGGRFKSVISLGKKSGFGLSSGFTNAYDLSGVIGVKMFYDTSKKAVAFKFVKSKEEGMLSVKLRDKGGYIGGQSFIGKFKIDQNKYAGRYTPKEIKDDNLGRIFVIELKENESKT